MKDLVFDDSMWCYKKEPKCVDRQTITTPLVVNFEPSERPKGRPRSPDVENREREIYEDVRSSVVSTKTDKEFAEGLACRPSQARYALQRQRRTGKIRGQASRAVRLEDGRYVRRRSLRAAEPSSGGGANSPLEQGDGGHRSVEPNLTTSPSMSNSSSGSCSCRSDRGLEDTTKATSASNKSPTVTQETH